MPLDWNYRFNQHKIKYTFLDLAQINEIFISDSHHAAVLKVLIILSFMFWGSNHSVISISITASIVMV